MVGTVVVIDTDAGTDDATALFVTLAAHQDPKVDFRIVGITCVNGNTTVDNVCVNVTRILNTVNASDIPIFRGADRPMVLPYELGGDCVPYHGFDGFGDVGLAPETARTEKESAALALIRLGEEFKGELTILALGPLTNLSLAARLDPDFVNNVKEVVFMGGNTEAVGNTTVCGEFNFRVDPEAAYVTLSSFPCPITIVPWEINKRQNHKEFRLNELSKIESPQMALLNLVEVNNLQKIRWSPCDALAAAVLIEPKVVKEGKLLHVTTELSGIHTRGQMVIDHENLLNQRANATIVYSIDVQIYLDILRWGVGGPYYAPRD